MRNAIAYCLALGTVVLLGQSAQAQLLEKKALSLAAARKMVAVAEAEAERNNWPGVVAVVDDGGWIILLERMDHAALTAGVELAAGKARSAPACVSPERERQRRRVSVAGCKGRISAAAATGHGWGRG
jgi:glc operon protein GlcG